MSPYAGQHLHFVTGRLAERMLRETVAPLAEQRGFGWSVDVLPITVAALMTPAWVAKRVAAPEAATLILVPGHCGGDLAPIESATGRPVVRGPRDLHQLPAHLGGQADPPPLREHSIRILAEINHCPRLTLGEIVRQGLALAADGADLIDVGCEPGGGWSGVGDAVRALRDAGLRVSIDSFDPQEVAAAVAAGAELVLSVNSTNRDAAPDWGCPVVVLPDDPATLAGLDETLNHLAARGTECLIDPILEPIGCGFAASLGRYITTRERYPQAEMLMGIGNLTEMTEADSAGINLLLLGVCQELGVRNVLTTQVIPWAQTSVKECAIARRVAHWAVTQGAPPKHLDAGLVTLRDARVARPALADLDALAGAIRDHDYRVFAGDDALHLVGAGLRLSDADPFALAARLLAESDAGRLAKPLDPSHAFYLGYELAKATTAMHLGKHYEQDEALDWGYLSRPESRGRLPHGRRRPEG